MYYCTLFVLGGSIILLAIELLYCLWLIAHAFAVVELFYSLKRILLLGGLNHAPAIWLQMYSSLLHLLSSRLRQMMSACRGFFCCCNSWRLYLLRRRVTYAMGASFIEHYFFMLFWSYLGCLGAPSGALWAVLGRSLATPLLAAQAA